MLKFKVRFTRETKLLRTETTTVDIEAETKEQAVERATTIANFYQQLLWEKGDLKTLETNIQLRSAEKLL